MTDFVRSILLLRRSAFSLRLRDEEILRIKKS